MRRRFLSVVLVLAPLAAVVWASGPGSGLGPDEALERLVQGNRRYLFSKMSHPSEAEARRREIARVQHPFAVVLGCSDSRVPPELVFDQGLGDLFVIRVAGNIVDDAVLGSIEYAVEHLGTSLVVVLGHERCGAVDATVKGGEVPGHVGALVKCIRPAVERVRGRTGDALDNAVRSNVGLVVEQLQGSAPVLAELVHAGKIKVVGARYDLDTGLVDFLQPESGAAPVAH